MTPLSGYAAHFGVENIPFGIATSAQHAKPSAVTRYEDKVVFLAALNNGLSGVDGLPPAVLSRPTLNELAALPQSTHQALRGKLQTLISEDPTLSSLPAGAVEGIDTVEMYLPFTTGDFTDFSCSYDHVQNASEAMTGKRSAPPAFFNMPIGYAGRCSSLMPSGTSVERPLGQYWEGKPSESPVAFGPSRKMDFELELGAFVGEPVASKTKVTASQAEKHIFGYVLVNDWSARDIQQLEMIPLGPLNGKNAGTTISPWVVTTAALEPFRGPGRARVHEDPVYLAQSGDHTLSVDLQVFVSNSDRDASDGQTVCQSNTSNLYWTLAQCLAHQAIGGCGLRTGDLLATGTVSGEGKEAHGCLMEHMRACQPPPRGYLEDGETVTLSGYCGSGVGFGECTATLTPAMNFEL